MTHTSISQRIYIYILIISTHQPTDDAHTRMHQAKKDVDTTSIDDLVNTATDEDEVKEIFVAFDLNDDQFLDASELGKDGADKIATIEALDGEENDDQKLTLEEYLTSFNFTEEVDPEQQQVLHLYTRSRSHPLAD